MLDGIVNLGSEILKRVIPDKQALTLAQKKLDEIRYNGDLQVIIERTKIAQEEAKSSDKWTSRARPSFMYLFYTILLSVPIGAIIGIFYPNEMQIFYANFKLGFESIPSALWGTFTAGYLGYSGLRSFEKCKNVTK